MFKRGEVRVPLAATDLDGAKVLFVDPCYLFRLVLEQYWPDKGDVIAAIFGNLANGNQKSYLLTKWRSATGNMDRVCNARDQGDVVDRMLEVVAKVAAESCRGAELFSFFYSKNKR